MIRRQFKVLTAGADFEFRISGAFSPGFTLIELMISLAMVLILIIGINFVFRTAADSVGAGEALNTMNSSAQAAQPRLFDDLRNVAKNPPCFIIASQLVTQYLNADDAKTSSDPTVIPIDNAGNYDAIGAQPSNLTTIAAKQIISPATLNYRNHRADLLEFFAHGQYSRRTGNDGTYFGTETSQDAFIQIGHAALPANDLSGFYGPSSLPNNVSGLFNGTTVAGVPRVGAYASDWVLARRAILLMAGNPLGPPATPGPTAIASTDNYYPQITTDQLYAQTSGGNTSTPTGIDTTFGSNGAPSGGTAYGANMTPLSYESLDYNSNIGQGTSTPLQSSRYDLAGVTPDQYDRIIANAILGWQQAGYTGGATAASLWWNPLVYSLPLNQTIATPPQYATLTNGTAPYTLIYFNAVPGYTAPTNPTQEAFKSTANTANPPYNLPTIEKYDPGQWLNRPQINPLIQSPVTAASLAEMSPYFLAHCSQFIVEYTGDYMQQDNTPTDATYGAMTGLGPDGQIDYYLDANGNKHIRWYGMPRSSTGQLHSGDSNGTQVLIRGPNLGTDNPIAAGVMNYFTDVIPLRDYYTMYLDKTLPSTNLYAPPWEVDVNFDPPGASEDYAAPTAGGYPTGNKIAFGDFNNPPRYVAAWHDDMPAMIRILIKVDDPNNQIKDGPWYEYVFKLK